MRQNRAEKLKLKEIANKYNITTDEAIEVVSSMYAFIKEKTGELDFGTTLTEEEFLKIKSNFNIPCIGKFYANYYIYKRYNKIDGENKESIS